MKLADLFLDEDGLAEWLHPFVATLDATWFRDLLTDALLLVITSGIGGYWLSRAQERWAVARGRAEAEWQHQKEILVRAAIIQRHVREAQGLFQNAEDADAPMVSARLANEAMKCVVDALTDLLLVTVESELAFGVIPDAGNAIATINALGKEELTSLRSTDLDLAVEASTNLVFALRRHMHYPVRLAGTK